jgi:hypothetical protein
MHQVPPSGAIPPAGPEIAPPPDAGLRLEVDGRLIPPDSVTQGPEGRSTHRFTIPPGASGARLLSRVGIPARDDPACGDHRRLGVALTHLRLRGPVLELHLPHDDPSLTEGFHPPEAGHRWTDGAGVIPAQWLRGQQAGCVLEVEISASGLRYLSDG